MTVIDLTSMAEPQEELKKEINDRLSRLQDQITDYCYQCAKCTSGCESHKLLELEPHRIVALAKRGLIDELVNSDIIWTCTSCFKCRERCPQRVAPVELLIALKNLAVASGKQVPGDYTEILQSVMSTGFIQPEQRITGSDGKVHTREGLDLPRLIPPDMNVLQTAIMGLAMEKV